MAQLVVRNLDDDVKRRLRERASLHGHSLEAEIREILRVAAQDDLAPTEPLGTRMARRFAGLGLNESFAELRGDKAQAASFEK